MGGEERGEKGRGEKGREGGKEGRRGRRKEEGRKEEGRKGGREEGRKEEGRLECHILDNCHIDCCWYVVWYISLIPRPLNQTPGQLYTAQMPNQGWLC